MQRKGVVPNVIAYTALIGAHEKGVRPSTRTRRAFKVFQAMQRQRATPDTVICNTLICVCKP